MEKRNGSSPSDLPYLKKSEQQYRKDEIRWLEWAKELQFIAQAGLTYSRDDFDLERFARIREISAEIMAARSRLSLDEVKGLFCNETGFQTPKIDTRGVIFRDGKILLVKEKSGEWSLPGGWMDVNQTIRSNTEKEVKEEAGLDVEAERIIALLDRNRYNTPMYAYNICKVFVLCRLKGGEFSENSETVASGYFSLDELPPLCNDKTTRAQVELCFDAVENDNWNPVFD